MDGKTEISGLQPSVMYQSDQDGSTTRAKMAK